MPGDMVTVWITLPDSAPKSRGRFALLVREFDSGETVLTSEFTCKMKKGSRLEVILKLPADMGLGYYLLVLRGPRKQEIANEALIVVDSLSLTRFNLADKALQCTIDAAKAKQDKNSYKAMLLLEKAAQLYDGADSPQCAGLALADAAEVARTVAEGQDRFESFGWAAVKFLLVAGDVKGAGYVTRKLVDSASSISDAVSRYVETAQEALAVDSAATGVDDRRRTILNAATDSLPPPNEEGIMDNILATMRRSQANQYVAGKDELIYLATSEIAVYSPGVLINTPRGPILHCTTFVSYYRQLNHEYAAR
jgi:hypothetical protein